MLTGLEAIIIKTMTFFFCRINIAIRQQQVAQLGAYHKRFITKNFFKIVPGLHKFYLNGKRF